MIRGLKAGIAATVVMIGFASPMIWLWPVMMTAPYLLGFLIMVAWFVAAIHFATEAALWALR